MSIFIKCLERLRITTARLCPAFYRCLLKRRSIVKYFVAGSFTTVLDLFSLFILHGLFDFGIVFSTTLAFILSLWLSFYIQKVWTFNHQGHKRAARQAGLYFLTIFINLNINGFGMHILVTDWHIWYILAQVMVGVVMSIESFFVYRFIVFRKHPENYEINC